MQIYSEPAILDDGRREMIEFSPATSRDISNLVDLLKDSLNEHLNLRTV